MKKIIFSMAFILMCSNSAFAMRPFDTRSVSMGGIGVSTAESLVAPFHNPALGAKDNDFIGILFPTFGFSVYDKGNILEKATNVSDSVIRFQNNPTTGNAEAIISDLKKMKNNQASIEFGTALAGGFTLGLVTINPFVKANVNLLVLTDIDDNDLSLSAASTSINSTVNTMGLVLYEYGAGIATKLPFTDLYLGATPKIQQLHTVNYVASLTSFDIGDFYEGRYSNSHSNFNIDLGLAYELGFGFTTGLVTKNLFSQTYKTKTVEGTTAEYTLNPVTTASVSWQFLILTVGADLDLNKTKGFTKFALKNSTQNPSDDDVQMFGLGAEVDVLGMAQARAGYKRDLQNNLQDEYTLGVGFSPLGLIHIDIGGSYGGSNQYGISAQMAYTF